MSKTLGVSKLSPGNRLTVSKEVVDQLKLKVGEFVIFVVDDRGNLIVKKAQ